MKQLLSLHLEIGNLDIQPFLPCQFRQHCSSGQFEPQIYIWIQCPLMYYPEKS